MKKNYFNNKYFEKKNLNDPKRLAIFDKEKKILKKYINFKGRVLDVGCGTGEFLDYLDWKGLKYGMEINKLAKNKAKKKRIKFNHNLLNKKNYFDLIIFRGVLHYLPLPFYYIQKAHSTLKKNGLIVFLSTPNANSLSYKLFNFLHLLKPIYYFVPSNVTLKNTLINFGFKICEQNYYSYFSSPYSSPIIDHIKFLLCILKIKKNNNFPFYKNMFYMIGKK